MTTTDPILTLHQLFSPAFPVGAFAYSHGLETEVQAGRVTDAAHLQDWIATVLKHGAGWSDAVLFTSAATGADPDTLADLAIAMAPSAERRQETLLQGGAFAQTVAQIWDVDLPTGPYPVVAGQAVALLSLPAEDALRLYLQAMVSNLAAAGVRLVPLGQTDGQRIVQALSPLCTDLAARAWEADLDDLGGFAPLVDIASQHHEALYSRIFRS